MNLDMNLCYEPWWLWWLWFGMFVSVSLVMGVPCPCHWCTNGMTHVWVSDFSHRPIICYVWPLWLWFSAGAYGYILGSWSVSVSGDWYCVQYMPFTYLGASYSNYWGLPSHYMGYLRGLPSVWLWELNIVKTWARVHFDSVYAGDCIDSVYLFLFSLYICFPFPTLCLFMLPIYIHLSYSTLLFLFVLVISFHWAF